MPTLAFNDLLLVSLSFPRFLKYRDHCLETTSRASPLFPLKFPQTPGRPSTYSKIVIGLSQRFLFSPTLFRLLSVQGFIINFLSARNSRDYLINPCPLSLSSFIDFRVASEEADDGTFSLTLPSEDLWLNRQYKVTWPVRVAKTVPLGTRFTIQSRVTNGDGMDIYNDVEVVVK